jgi:hypothetical protein
MKFKLEIKPAIPPDRRHQVEKFLEAIGYNIVGGGTHTDMSVCDITFDDFESEVEPEDSIFNRIIQK